MQLLQNKSVEGKPSIVTENEVIQVLGMQKSQLLKSLFTQILATRFSLSDSDISLLLKKNELTEDAAIEEAIRRTGRQDITFTFVSHSWMKEIEVTFSINTNDNAEKQLFEFWSSMRLPKDSGWDLNVIPAEHPVFQCKRGPNAKKP